MTYTQVWDPMTNAPNENVVKRDEDGAFIPLAEGNRDYAEYKKWLAEGNQPNPPEQPPTPGVGVPRVELPEPMDPAIKQYIDDQLDQLRGG